jgi:hypothetical protein
MLSMKKFFALTVAATCSLALAGCETGDDRTLAAGQACLDAATPATANQCVTIVQGLTSQESYMIRCSANFIAQGFTGTRIADAITKIKDNDGSGTDPMVGMMAYLSFTSASPSADEAISNCETAGSKSMLRLATAAKLATTIASFTGGIGSIDPDSPTAAQDLKNKIDQLISSPNPTANAELGSTAVVAAQAYCAAGSSYEGTEVCQNLTAAVNSSSDPATIGAQLLQQLQANTGH